MIDTQEQFQDFLSYVGHDKSTLLLNNTYSSCKKTPRVQKFLRHSTNVIEDLRLVFSPYKEINLHRLLGIKCP